MMEINGLAYALWTAGAVLLGLALFALEGRKLGRGARAWTAALALPLGLLGARAFYVLARLEFFVEIGGWNWLWPEDMFSDWGVATGFALWGAVGGCALAACLAGRITGQRTADILDALAPAGALAIGLYRFGEFWIGEGVGPYVETEALCFFPLAIVNEWEEWKLAVFVMEGLAALVILGVLLLRGTRGRPGDRARLFLILFCATQIVLESLRRDSFLRWMFVRVSQLTAALVLAGLMAAAIVRWRRHPEREPLTGRRVGLCCGLVLLGVGATIALEYAMDKSGTLPLWLAYVLEACCCVLLGVTAGRIVLPGGRKREGEETR